MVLIDILEEHIEEADFLWQQRANALASRDYTLDELAELEERLLAHLDGLVLGEKAAWSLLEPKLMGGEVGDVFAAAFVALDSGDSVRVEAVAKLFTEAEGDVLDGIRHALRHTAYAGVESLVRPHAASPKAPLCAAAVDVLSFRRMPIEAGRLQELIGHDDPIVAASALNAVGRLRITQLKESIERSFESKAAAVRLAALRAGLLVGNLHALGRCRAAIVERRDEAADAIVLLAHAGHADDLRLLVDAASDPVLARVAVMAMGVLGRVHALDPLLRCVRDPALARLAGDAMRVIIGVDLKGEQLTIAKPGHPAAAVAQEDDEELVEDPDEGLPWPDPEKLAVWWRMNASRFEKSGRYRDGKPHGRDDLLDTLRYGHLLARHHAAFELALLDPKAPYLETHAFAKKQKVGAAEC